LALRAVTTVENGILLNNNKDKTIKQVIKGSSRELISLYLALLILITIEHILFVSKGVEAYGTPQVDEKCKCVVAKASI